MTCARCGHGHYDEGGSLQWGRFGRCTDKTCDCPAFVPEQERRQHSHGALTHAHYQAGDHDHRPGAAL